MMEPSNLVAHDSTTAALEALRHGYQPVPIHPGTKRPRGAAWTHRRFTEDDVEDAFGDGVSIGLATGEPSGGLIDIDLDHPIAWRIASYFLPPTRMRTGRAGNPSSHYWYRVTDTIPSTRPYKVADGSMSVELRSTGGQTLIPPSIHPSGESYRWEAEPWGGEEGPAEITGAQLRVRVASLALAAVLIENWPPEGGRHDAYLALAGGMLRFGREGVHPYWSRALPQLIEALAEATHDGDGSMTRVSEVIPTTEAKLAAGGRVQGWTTLEGIIGEKSVKMARVLVAEIEGIVEWQKYLPLPSTQAPLLGDPDRDEDEDEDDESPGEVNPLDDRAESWEPVNLEPYLAGEVTVPKPSILRRTDGKGIFYPGRVNSLFGKSESAKSWVALYACLQQIAIGERVLYIDLEDDPAMTIKRLRLMGGGDDDIRYQFMYIRPEGPHQKMQRDNWGNERPTELGWKNASLLETALIKHDPGLIIVDGMSVLYGLHGLNTNDVMSTDVITNWLKSLCRNNRSTVIVIDHTHKGAEKGAMPIGSQHKVSMVQGSAIQVVPILPPRPGVMGHVELAVGKDRPGGVREISSPDKVQIVADVFLDSTIAGRTQVSVQPWTPGDVTIPHSDKSEVVMSKAEKIEGHIVAVFGGELGRWLTASEIMSGIIYDGMTKDAFDKAKASLISKGVLVKQGTTKNAKYGLNEQYGSVPEDE